MPVAQVISLSLTAQGASENEAEKWFKHIEEGDVALECRHCDGRSNSRITTHPTLLARSDARVWPSQRGDSPSA